MESAFAAALCHLLKISEFLSPKIFSLISSGTVPIISCHCENDKKKKPISYCFLIKYRLPCKYHYIDMNSLNVHFVVLLTVLFPAQVLVNALCSSFSCSHSKDYGCGSGYSISTGIYTLFGGLTVVFICNDTLPFVYI